MQIMKEAILKTKAFLQARQHAYQITFNLENIFAERVLKDLAKFCRANESAFNKDERLHAVLEGRREVWLRICHQLKLDSDQIWKLYGRSDLE